MSELNVTTIKADGGEIVVAENGIEAFVEILGETWGGQRRRVHVEVDAYALLQLINAAIPLYHKMIQAHRELDDTIPF